MKLVLTGFEPFGKDTSNPSWEAVSRLKDSIEGAELVKICLPVVYDEVGELLSEILRREQPDAVICVGQAGGRAVVTPEFVAINQKEASIPDNAGVSYAGLKIAEDGPDAYFATIPVRAIVAELKERGIPAAVSYSAGAYVCNSTMYHLLHAIHRAGGRTLGGFIHVPYECGQMADKSASLASLPLSMLTEALDAAARVVIRQLKEDGRVTQLR